MDALFQHANILCLKLVPMADLTEGSLLRYPTATITLALLQSQCMLYALERSSVSSTLVVPNDSGPVSRAHSVCINGHIWAIGPKAFGRLVIGICSVTGACALPWEIDAIALATLPRCRGSDKSTGGRAERFPKRDLGISRSARRFRSASLTLQ